MIHQDLINKIASLIAALQRYAATKVDMGQFDVGASVEVLIGQVLAVTEGLTIVNKNQIRVSFPAIDLADDTKRIAIQVTTNVSTKKWKETVKKFHDHNLDAAYDTLRIIGFCEAVKPRACPANVLVQGPEAILGTLKTLRIETLSKLEADLRNSFDFSKLSPLSDKDCFGVVLSVLDRDAIRHYTCVEGSFHDFSSALKEIREIINTGQVKGKHFFAKPLSQYSPPYEDLLHTVDLEISSMLAELNRARRDAHYYLTEAQKLKIDRAREKIISTVNKFCETCGFSRRIHGIR